MRYVWALALIPALLLLAAPVQADVWQQLELCVHSDSDSAGAYTFTPAIAATETLAVALTDTLPGIYTQPLVGWGTADTTMVIRLFCESNGGTWGAWVDSLGVSLQGSWDNPRVTAAPTWVTILPVELIDPDDTPLEVSQVEVTAKPYPWYRVLVKWNDLEGGEGTRTMSAKAYVRRL